MDATKVERVLGIYKRLMEGGIISKSEEALRYGVNEKSIQRDIDDIRNHLETDADSSGFFNTVIYDRNKKGYLLDQVYRIKLSNGEILAVCKILLDSRSLVKSEMKDLIDKLISCCVPEENRKIVKDLVNNELFHYVELRHKSKFLDTMWEIGQAVRNAKFIEIDYERTKDKTIVHRKVQPVAIMFSEFYFYMTAFIEGDDIRENFDNKDDPFPTIYRIDRIKALSVLDEHFHIPYSSRFEEGEFRKRIQFMYGGKLQKVKFKYTGSDIDAILDRLPTAQIIDESEDGYIVSAETFGSGISMWLQSQGEAVKIMDG